MRVRLVDTRPEVAAALAALRAAGWIVTASREYPARTPDHVRVYATATRTTP